MNRCSSLILILISFSIQSQEYSIDSFFKDYNPVFHSSEDFAVGLDSGESENIALSDNQFRRHQDLTFYEKEYLQTVSDMLVYDYSNAGDKLMHYNAGYIIGSISSELCSPIYKKQTNKSRRLRFWCSFTAATVAGVAKEFYDSTGRGNVEAADAIATSLGGFQLELRF